jgi:tartrate-resistant acid phosphatase type 5
MSVLLLTGCIGNTGDVTGITPGERPPSDDTTDDTQETGSPDDSPASTGARTLPPLGGGAERYRFAVLGDFGNGSDDSFAVAELVARLEPDFIITVGDNNYPDGELETVDFNVGQLYHPWIGSYKGKYGEGSKENRFWPCPGNHDWDSDAGLDPYIEYFTLPGNERYYDFRYEDFHFFCVDSDTREPDGTTADSPQGEWLKEAMTSSNAPVKIVYMHHPPYSSGSHGNNEWMHWPYLSWGATMLFSGHDHIYERQVHDGVPFIVTGIGGYRTYSVRDPSAHSQLAVSDNHGTTLVRVFDGSMIVETWTTEDVLLDRFSLRFDQPLTASPRLVRFGDEWAFTMEEPEGDWQATDFDDSGWMEGRPEGSPVWARRRFSAPADIRSLTLELIAEGTTEVFLNDSVLTESVTGSLSLLELPTAALIEGENVLAIHNEGGSENGRLQLSMLGASGTPLIETGADWAVTTTAPMQNWIRPGFNDSAWKPLTAPVVWDYEAGDTATPGSPKSMWLRHRFTVTAPEDIDDLLMSMARSDAAVVYLNGREIHRANLPEGELAEGVRASVPVESDWVAAPVSTLVSSTLLVEGENVIAVQVHTAAADSTGLYLDLRLTAL